LLYNRGSDPRRAISGNADAEESTRGAVNNATSEEKGKLREKIRWLLILRLGSAVVAVDAFIRWTHLNPDRPTDVSPWTAETSEPFFWILIGCFAETIAFHAGVIFACAFVLNSLDVARSWKRSTSKPPISGIRQEFRYSLIPLTIFYSSLTKLFLLLLLSIWRPSPSATHDPHPRNPLHGTVYDNVFISSALEILDDDKLDREWVVRNILGGMAAGFGLRVILDCHPILTTMIILVGWAVKTAVATLVSEWVGGNEKNWEAWFAYSIP